MAHNHRTIPPRRGPWEVINLRPWNPQQWIFRTYPPQVLKQISLRLRDSLISQDVTTFLRSKYDQSEADDGWRCWRYLGGGGFGAAAVWKEFDKDGNVLDEMVIKQSRDGRDAQYNDSKHVLKHPAMEAETQSILNMSKSDNLVHLRGYKVIASNLPSVQPILRFYLEYAPYGDLYNLTTRYRAFSRYLPELFLWHLFNSLARAAQILDKDPDPRSRKQDFVVHLDIKPENIFLGYESAKNEGHPNTGGLDGERYGYPTVKLGDFGLAVRTFTYQQKPVSELSTTGTWGYRPPEQQEQYGNGWTVPPNRETDLFTTQMNIWAIGKVMYDTFSLSTREKYFGHRAEDRRAYDINRQSPLLNYLSVPFLGDRLSGQSPYSSKLSELIERCMHVEPSRRPSADELYRETKAAMQQQEQKPESNSNFSVRHRKLYYVGNTINDMPITARNCHIPMDAESYFSLLEPNYNDPDEPSLDVYTRQIYNSRTGQEREIYKAYAAHKQKVHARDLQWRTDFYAAGERVRITPYHIEFPDPDNHLTYEPDGNDDGNDSGNGGGNGDGDGDDADDGNGDGGPKAPGGANAGGNGINKVDKGRKEGGVGNHKNKNDDGPEKGRGGNDANGAANTSADNHGKHSVDPNLSSLSVATQPALDRPKAGKRKSIDRYSFDLNGNPSRPAPRKLYEPYVLHDAHEETFERASVNGPGLEYVINVDPDPKTAARIAQMDKMTGQTTATEVQALTQDVRVGSRQRMFAGYRSLNQISSSSEGSSQRNDKNRIGSSGKRLRVASVGDHTALESSNRGKRSKNHDSRTFAGLAAAVVAEMKQNE